MLAYVQIRKVIDSGVLGRIVQIDFTNSGFSRRWDWQTLQGNNGGNLMNHGPHPLDQALQLFDPNVEPRITCMMDRANTSGDAEDYVKLIMGGPGCPTIDIEVSSCSAYPRPQFIVHGTTGGLQGNGQNLVWKFYKPQEAPEQRLVREPLFDKEGNPVYCSEKLTWHEERWELPQNNLSYDSMTEQLYLMLHRTLTLGAPLEITP